MSQRSDRGLQTAGQGAVAGASIGTAIVPGWGTAIGAVVGGVAGYVVGSQPIPKDNISQTQETSFSNISFEGQYTYNQEFTSSINELNTKITLADKDAATDDFNKIMGIGTSLASIYSGAKGAGGGSPESSFNILNSNDGLLIA